MEQALIIGTKARNPGIFTIECARLKLVIDVLPFEPVMNYSTIVYRTCYEDGNKLYFLVNNGYSRFGYENWKFNMFTEMISFYSEQVLQKEIVSIASANRLATMFYDSTQFNTEPPDADYLDFLPDFNDPDQIALQL